MPKARKIKASENGHKILFECPGCGCAHVVNDRWSFNDDFDKPTFKPSVLVNKDKPERRCHSFVTDGKIRFLNDCRHDLAGQTVELPDI